MKKTFFIILVSVITTISSISQIPDIVRYTGNGIVELTSGEKINGKVEFRPNQPARVEIIADGQEKATRYKSDEVKEFTAGDKKFFAIKMKGEVSVGNSTYFAQLITPADARIRIYVFEKQEISIIKSYYASIPGDESAYALTDLRFTPFKKIIEYVKDCPSVVDKITAKEKGFWIPLTATDEMRKEVFLNISNAHYECK